jgi:predicted Zn finger-like uncharacterized protein
MKITCQSCQSKYTVSDERVQGKTVKIRCRKCGATILVSSGGASMSTSVTAEPDSMPPGADGAQTYQVNIAEGDQRTMSLAEVLAAYNSTAITAETYVWTEGMGDWLPLGQVEAIVAALHNPSAMAAPPEMSAMAAPAADTAMAEPAAAEPLVPRAAARREAGQRPDLFGSGRSAPMPSAEEIATSAPAFNGGAAARSTTGQRDENSMLFSLSALTAKAPSGGGSGKASSLDDSGLIDLKALANSMGAPKPAASELALPHDGGLFPLAPPPINAAAAAPVAIPTTPPPAASKAPIFIGVGIAVAALAAVGVFFATRDGGTPVAPVETTTQQAATPPVATTAEPVPTAAPTASAEASAAPTTTAVAKGGKVPPRGGGGAKAGGGAGGSTPPPASTPTTPPPPKKDKCGCAPADLMCAMKCSAK